MRFTIRHQTSYRYSQQVQLNPHQLRFHPREDGAQTVTSHRLDIFPEPVGRNAHVMENQEQYADLRDDRERRYARLRSSH